MSRVLEEFYTNLNTCGVSAHTAEGVVEDLIEKCFVDARREYFDMYLKYLEEKKQVLEKKKEKEVEKTMDAFEKRVQKTKPVQLEKIEEDVTDLRVGELEELGVGLD